MNGNVHDNLFRLCSTNYSRLRHLQKNRLEKNRLVSYRVASRLVSSRIVVSFLDGLPTGGGFEDTEPSAPAADRRRRARFGGWLSGTVSGRPACEQLPRDDRRRSVQARRHARSRPTPRPDRAVRTCRNDAGMMDGCCEHASGTAAHSQGRSRLSRSGFFDQMRDGSESLHGSSTYFLLKAV